MALLHLLSREELQKRCIFSTSLLFLITTIDLYNLWQGNAIDNRIIKNSSWLINELFGEDTDHVDPSAIVLFIGPLWKTSYLSETARGVGELREAVKQVKKDLDEAENLPSLKLKRLIQLMTMLTEAAGIKE